MACKFAKIYQKSVECAKTEIQFHCPHCSINASGDTDNYGDLLQIKFNNNSKCEHFQEGNEHYLENDRIF
jgi:hypothetical protein